MGDINDKQQDIDISKEYMLSTLDNPYNPFTQYDEWYIFDCQKGYYSCSYLAREFEAHHKPYLTEEQKAKQIQEVIQNIVDNDKSGIFCKVTRNEVVKPIELN